MTVTTRFYTYARALRSPSEYSKRMKFLSNKIFGEPRRPEAPGTKRIIKMFSRKPYEDRKEIVEYYPAHEHTFALFTYLRAYGLYRNEHLDFKDEMNRKRVLRGKKSKKWRELEEVMQEEKDGKRLV